MPGSSDKNKNLPIILLLVVLLVLGGIFLFRAVFGKRDCECAGTANFRNLGYDPIEVWTEPSPVLKDTPFEVHWRICYEEDSCDVEGAGQSGDYSELLWIWGEDPDAPALVSESFPRTPMEAGDCEDRVFEHPGVSDDRIEIKVEWRTSSSVEGNDCQGDTDVDVFENNIAAAQPDVVCACEEQEYYDIKVAVGPTYHVGDRLLKWTVFFDYEPCEAGPAEKEIEEHFTLVRKSTGETVAERDESFPLLMGGNAFRDFKLTDWVVGEVYVAKVTLGGPDCHPTLTGLDENNGGLLEFTVEF